MRVQQGCRAIWEFLVSGLSPLSAAGSVILPLIVITLVGGIIAITVSTDVMSETATRDAERRLDSAATSASEQIGDVLSRSLGDAYALSQSSVLRSNEATPAKKLAEMRMVQAIYGTFEDVALVGLDGDLITSTDYKYYGEWTNNGLFQSAAHGYPALADATSQTDPHKVVIHIASPVMDTNDNITAVLLAQIDMEDIWQMIGRAKIDGTGSLYLVNETGDIIAGPDRSRLFEKMEFAAGNNLMSSTHKLIQYKDGGSEMCAVLADVNLNVPWSGNRWQFVATLASADAFATVNKLQTICYIVIIAFLLMFIVGALILGHFMSRKVRTIARGTAEIVAGNFSYRLPLMLPNDVGQLADSFNSMAARLESSSAEIARLKGGPAGGREAKAGEIEKSILDKIQSERLATIGYIAASVAHELNGPLNSISCYAQLGAAESDKFHSPEEMPGTLRNTSEYFRNIDKELQRSKSIMGKLISFVRYSKTDSGATNVNQVLSDTLAVTRHHLEMHNVDLVTQLQPDLPLIHADTYKLQQVFLDIILSAQKAMPGGGRLIVETGKTEGDNNKIEVRFSRIDSGTQSVSLNKVFEPLSSLEAGEQVTRLDLSGAHDLAKQFGGEIRVSRESAGTTFIISLPLINASSPKNEANVITQPAKIR